MNDYTKLIEKAESASRGEKDAELVDELMTDVLITALSDLTDDNSDKSQLLASFRKDNEELQAKVKELEERISAETDEAYQDGYQAALKEDDEAAITLEVRKMDKEQKMKELLEGLYVDFQMLEEGTWIPDEHSIEASKDAVAEIADMLNMPMERSE